MRRPTLVHIVLGALILWTAVGPLSAQVDTGAAEASPRSAVLTGRVTSAAGEALAGVTVAIPSLDRGVLTNRSGDFRIEGLSTGTVTVRFEVLGYGTREASATLVVGTSVRLDVALESAAIEIGAVTVTARRVEERAQEVPIPVAVVRGAQLESSGTFNVQRLQLAVPTVQFYTTNPRNSFLNIRGLGLPFGLANDGIEPGVGLYVDGVFYARPAAATLDFLDVEQIEVLRGPQGTLFGKNTTAGALNVTTRRPNFARPETSFELGYGNYGFTQLKASVTGPLLGRNLAGRLSFSGTRRDGLLRNVATGEDVNTLDNLGVRGQLRALPWDGVVLTVAADYTRQRPNGYAPVVAGVAPTLRAANRQFPQIASDLGYAVPSANPFDRTIDTDTPWRSNQNLGGAALTADLDVGPGRLTSISAWRFWDWDPSNDRDFTGLAVTTISGAPTRHEQWTQEVRYTAPLSPSLEMVVGAFGFRQTIDGTVSLENGPDSWRWNLAPSSAAATPGLLDGYGSNAFIDFETVSAALFGQLEWNVTNRLRVLPGIRLNYDQKEGTYDQVVYGGLDTTDPALIALKNSVARSASYDVSTDDTNLSGQFTLGYSVAPEANAYVTYATSFKSVGLNIAGGLPNNPSTGLPDVSIAVVPSEDERHVEIGVKTTLLPGFIANLNAFDTEVRDYQTQVFSTEAGVVRGYLANAERVRVRGAEFDGSASFGALVLHGAASYSDGQHTDFTGAPAPLEGTGGPQFVDISGSPLAGLSEWAASLGGEYSLRVSDRTELLAGVDASYRSSYSSSTTPSDYLRVDGYSLLNARIGFRWNDRWSAQLWSRNLLDKDYFEQLNAVGGGTGLYVGFLGEPRTFGVTLKRAS
jgi:iron complex outermembrane receptor protein